MSGTRTGGLKASVKIKANNPFFYAEIGAIGGANGHTGGFATPFKGTDGLTGPQRASVAGLKGGTISRRGPSLKKAHAEFQEGFFEPSFIDKLKGMFR